MLSIAFYNVLVINDFDFGIISRMQYLIRLPIDTFSSESNLRMVKINVSGNF